MTGDGITRMTRRTDDSAIRAADNDISQAAGDSTTQVTGGSTQAAGGNIPNIDKSEDDRESEATSRAEEPIARARLSAIPSSSTLVSASPAAESTPTQQRRVPASLRINAEAGRIQRNNLYQATHDMVKDI